MIPADDIQMLNTNCIPMTIIIIWIIVAELIGWGCKHGPIIDSMYLQHIM